jgi:hypothetical protein
VEPREGGRDGPAESADQMTNQITVRIIGCNHDDLLISHEIE